MVTEKYNKPYLVYETYRTYSDYLIYKHQERKTDRIIFFRGGYIEPEDFDLIFHGVTAEKRIRQFDCPPNDADVILANQRMLEILNEVCPDDFQAFDMLIVNDEALSPVFEIKEYKLINIIKTVDAIDREKSECYFYDDGDIMGIERRILKSIECMGDTHLARAKYFEGYILASPTLKKACEKAKIKGLKFLKDDSV